MSIPAAQIGSEIREARVSFGMTQAEVAEASGVHRKSISKYETGVVVPSMGELWFVTEALHIDLPGLLRRVYGSAKESDR